MIGRLLDWAIQKEPAVAAGGFASVVSTAAGLVALWGIPMSDTTQTALVSTGSILIPAFMGLAVFIRQVVVPVPKAEKAIKTALNTEPPKTAADRRENNPADILKNTRV